MSFFNVNSPGFERELLTLEQALIREEMREKRLRRILRYLSAAVIVNILCWILYFIYLYTAYHY